jgi:predicted PurR-regulated permease PerM
MLIGAMSLALALGVLGLIWLLARPLALLFIAIVLAEALAPAVAWGERWIPRSIAIAVVYLGLLLIVTGTGWIAGPHVANQANRLAAQAPDLIAQGRQLIDRWGGVTNGELESTVQMAIDRFSALLLSLPVLIISSLVEIVIVIFLSVYWLAAAPHLRHAVDSLFPTRDRDPVNDVLDEMGHAVGGYVRGVILDAAIVGALAAGGLWLIGFDYPLLGGFVSMLGEFVPVLGPIAAAVPIVAIALLHSPTQALLVAAFYVGLEQVEGHLVTPNIMSSQTHLSQVMVIFAIFAGGAVGGLVGVMVAVPLVAALRVITVRIVMPAVRRWTGATSTDDAPAPTQETQ